MNIQIDFDGNPVKVLIAEDSPTQAARLAFLLEKYGYTVFSAANGKQALEMARELMPTLVISDILMPEINGYQLCHSIKQEEELKSIGVILLTSLADPIDVIKGLQCGADNFITKPYDDKYLLSRIQVILANRTIRKHEHTGMGVEIIFAGEKYLINSERQQILDLLLSTYETAVAKNNELNDARNELQQMNDQLELKVKERTAALMNEIAERKQAEKALRESEALYHSLVETLPQNIFRKDLDGHYQFMNQRFYEELGITSGEILGKTDYDFFPAELADKYRKDDQHVVETGRIFETTEEYHTPDQKQFITQTIKTPVLDDNGLIIGIQGIFWDVTKEKQAEEALKKSEQQYRQFFEDDLTGDVISSINGQILDCNPAFITMFGFNYKEDALSSNITNLYQSLQSRDQFIQSLQEKKQILGIEKEMRRIDEKVMYTIENNIGIFNENGEMEAIRSYIFNNTERRLLEEQLRQSQKMEAVGRLAGGIAHDFNNLAMAIKGYCDFALKEIPSESPARQDIDEVKKSADRTAAFDPSTAGLQPQADSAAPINQFK